MNTQQTTSEPLPARAGSASGGMIHIFSMWMITIFLALPAMLIGAVSGWIYASFMSGFRKGQQDHEDTFGSKQNALAQPPAGDTPETSTPQ